MSIDRPMFMNWLTLKKLGTSQNINTGDHMVASSLDFLLHFANIFLYVSLTLSLNVEPCFPFHHLPNPLLFVSQDTKINFSSFVMTQVLRTF